MVRSLLLSLFLLVSSVSSYASLMTRSHKVLVDTGGVPVELARGDELRDPSVSELYAFLRKCTINQRPYVLGEFVCTEFATTIQRQATAAGLRAGLVSVEFTQGVGHALVVFQTEKGEVYVDFTGGPQGDPNNFFQTIGYLAEGQHYGRLPLAVANENPVDYSFYLDIQSTWKKLDLLKETIDKENSAITQSQFELERARSRLNSANTQAVASFNKRVARHNDLLGRQKERVAIFNDVGKYLTVNYSINNYPVKNIDIWWP